MLMVAEKCSRRSKIALATDAGAPEQHNLPAPPFPGRRFVLARNGMRGYIGWLSRVGRERE
jgi:hypothetical protein